MHNASKSLTNHAEGWLAGVSNCFHGLLLVCLAHAALLRSTASTSARVNGWKLARSVASLREIWFRNLIRRACTSCWPYCLYACLEKLLVGQLPIADRASASCLS